MSGDAPSKRSLTPTIAMQPDPDVIVQVLGDEVVLLHLRSDRFYRLNRTGGRFWALVVAGYRLDQIEAQMLAEFEVAPEQLREELNGIVTALTEAQLLERRAGDDRCSD